MTQSLSFIGVIMTQQLQFAKYKILQFWTLSFICINKLAQITLMEQDKGLMQIVSLHHW